MPLRDCSINGRVRVVFITHLSTAARGAMQRCTKRTRHQRSHIPPSCSPPSWTGARTHQAATARCPLGMKHIKPSYSHSAPSGGSERSRDRLGIRSGESCMWMENWSCCCLSLRTEGNLRSRSRRDVTSVNPRNN